MIAAIYARKSTTRWPRVLLALPALLILTTSASAESAWVLWEHNGSPRAPWRQMEVFGTEPKCLTAAHREAGLRYTKESRRRFVHPGSVELSGPAVLVPLEFGDKWTISYECFPDTVDPRGPTG